MAPENQFKPEKARGGFCSGSLCDPRPRHGQRSQDRVQKMTPKNQFNFFFFFKYFWGKCLGSEGKRRKLCNKQFTVRKINEAAKSSRWKINEATDNLFTERDTVMAATSVCIYTPRTPDFHRFCVKWAVDVGALIVFVHYRLAPEHHLPAAYHDSISALQ